MYSDELMKLAEKVKKAFDEADRASIAAMSPELCDQFTEAIKAAKLIQKELLAAGLEVSAPEVDYVFRKVNLELFHHTDDDLPTYWVEVSVGKELYFELIRMSPENENSYTDTQIAASKSTTPVLAAAKRNAGKMKEHRL